MSWQVCNYSNEWMSPTPSASSASLSALSCLTFANCSVLKLPAWIAKWSSSRFCMDFRRMFSLM